MYPEAQSYTQSVSWGVPAHDPGSTLGRRASVSPEQSVYVGACVGESVVGHMVGLSVVGHVVGFAVVGP